MSNHISRPELADKSADIAVYDTIYVGFPVWWYIAPTIINSFLESYDFSGKKIILFATSSGSGFGKAVENLKPSAPNAEIIEGKVNPSIKDIEVLSAIPRTQPMTSSPATRSGWRTGETRPITAAHMESGSIPRRARSQASAAMSIWTSATRTFPRSSGQRG